MRTTTFARAAEALHAPPFKNTRARPSAPRLAAHGKLPLRRLIGLSTDAVAIGATLGLIGLLGYPVGAAFDAALMTALLLAAYTILKVSFPGRSVPAEQAGVLPRVMFPWLAACALVLPLVAAEGRTPHAMTMAALLPLPLGGAALLLARAAEALLIRLVIGRHVYDATVAVVRIAPSGADAASLARGLGRLGVRTVATLDLHPTDESDEAARRDAADRLVGTLLDRLAQVRADEIIVSGSPSRDLEALRDALRRVPLPVRLLPDRATARLLSGRTETIGSRRLFELQRAPLTPFERVAKRGLDVAVSGALLLILAPLLLTVSALIVLDTPGPVLFRQRRVGFCGRSFSILKFRSMTVTEDGPEVAQARRDDPRVTRVGRWLRATSVDELPQLVNVLRGDMSLVGPRPHAVAHHHHYVGIINDYAMRHHLAPGITGWAQVNGWRGETPTPDLMARRVEHDLWYVRHWSILLDLRILLMTFWAVAKPTRAY